MNNIKLKKEDYIIFISVFVFGLISHGYMFFNGIFSHDATRIFQSDTGYQLSLGRYIQPLYLNIRGYLQAPLLIGVLSLLYLSIGVTIINKVFNIKKLSSLVLISGLFVANITFTLGCASYMPWVDIYMLCFMICSTSFYFFCKGGWHFKILSCLLSFIVLGIYQPYFAVLVGLLIIYCIYLLLNKYDYKKVFIIGLQAIAVLLLSLLLYYFVLTIVINNSNISLATGYNGISTVGNYNGISIMALIIDTYKYIVKSFIEPNTFNTTVVGITNVLIFVVSVVNVIRIVKNNSIHIKETVLLVVLLTIIPFGINIIYFISKGLIHELVIYSFNLLYLLFFLLIDDISYNKINLLSSLFIILILFNNIVYSNQIYLKKELEFNTTKSICNRIMDRVESLDGYVAGKTPVLFVGDIQQSPLQFERYGYSNIKGVGITDWGSLSITYPLTIKWLLTDVMGYNINFAADDGYYQYQKEVIEMDTFPSKTSIKMFDGIAIIKLSK